MAVKGEQLQQRMERSTRSYITDVRSALAGTPQETAAITESAGFLGNVYDFLSRVISPGQTYSQEQLEYLKERVQDILALYSHVYPTLAVAPRFALADLVSRFERDIDALIAGISPDKVTRTTTADPWNTYMAEKFNITREPGESVADLRKRQKNAYFSAIMSVFTGNFMRAPFPAKGEDYEKTQGGRFNPLSYTHPVESESGVVGESWSIERIFSKGLLPHEWSELQHAYGAFLNVIDTGRLAMLNTYEKKWETFVEHLQTRTLTITEHAHLERFGNDYAPFKVPFTDIWQSALWELKSWHSRYVRITPEQQRKVNLYVPGLFREHLAKNDITVPTLAELKSYYEMASGLTPTDRVLALRTLISKLFKSNKKGREARLYDIAVSAPNDRTGDAYVRAEGDAYVRAEIEKIFAEDIKEEVVKARYATNSIGPKLGGGASGDKLFTPTYPAKEKWLRDVLGSPNPDTITPQTELASEIVIDPKEPNVSHYDAFRKVIRERVLRKFIADVVKANAVPGAVPDLQTLATKLYKDPEYSQYYEDESKLLAALTANIDGGVLFAEYYAEGQGWLFGTDEVLAVGISKATSAVSTRRYREAKSGEGEHLSIPTFQQLYPLPQDFLSATVTFTDKATGRTYTEARSLGWINGAKETFKQGTGRIEVHEVSYSPNDSYVEYRLLQTFLQARYESVARGLAQTWNKAGEVQNNYAGLRTYIASEEFTQALNKELRDPVSKSENVLNITASSWNPSRYNENFAPILIPQNRDQAYVGNPYWDPVVRGRDASGKWAINAATLNEYDVVGYSMVLNPYRPMMNLSQGAIQAIAIDAMNSKSLAKAVGKRFHMETAVSDLRREGATPQNFDITTVSFILYAYTGMPLEGYQNLRGSEAQSGMNFTKEDVIEILMRGGVLPTTPRGQWGYAFGEFMKRFGSRL